jgi:DNA-binding transcriptional regulator YiaG
MMENTNVRSGDTMTIKELRTKSGMTQKAFAEYFGIPKRTIEEWEGERRKCADYLLNLMQYKLENERMI